ncbi:hypothetical protein ARMSODRAFT_967121, partial [Armillaria solidipes]
MLARSDSLSVLVVGRVHWLLAEITTAHGTALSLVLAPERQRLKAITLDRQPQITERRVIQSEATSCGSKWIQSSDPTARPIPRNGTCSSIEYNQNFKVT